MKRICVIILFVSLTSFSQTNLEKSTYGLISDIIYQDTIPRPIQNRIIGGRVAIGKYTKEDSIKITENIKKSELYLYKYKANDYAKELLENYLKDVNNEFIVKIGKRKVSDIASEINIKNKEVFDFNRLSKRIIPQERPNYHKPYHIFSSPFKISKNKYFIYHYGGMHKTKSGGGVFIVYYIDKNGFYKIE